MSEVRKDLSQSKLEGRLDVLAYRLSESTVRLVENRLGVRLWDMVKTEVEDLIRDNIDDTNLSTEPCYKILAGLLKALKIMEGKGR